LDEATANVDFETDRFIQSKIKEAFSECTVITVAHWLSTIINNDKVIVMEKGTVAEIDHPYSLLVEEEGDDEITREGLFSWMIKASGEMADQLFREAKLSFEQG
jgi:ATP-binding cassette subfamily C (CFTR/MRP) protein 4